MESEAYEATAITNSVHLAMHWRDRHQLVMACAHISAWSKPLFPSRLFVCNIIWYCTRYRAYRSSYMISGCKRAILHFAFCILRAHKMNTLISMEYLIECNQHDKMKTKKTKKKQPNVKRTASIEHRINERKENERIIWIEMKTKQSHHFIDSTELPNNGWP